MVFIKYFAHDCLKNEKKLKRGFPVYEQKTFLKLQILRGNTHREVHFGVICRYNDKYSNLKYIKSVSHTNVHML